MEKFAITLNNLKDHVFYECILRGSKVAVKHKIKDFYTCKGEPKGWKQDFMTDVHESERVEYNEQLFYTHSYFNNHGIAYVFYGGHVYSYDSYFADCEIFAEILKETETY